MTAPAEAPAQHPVAFDVAYPERELDRLSTGLRVVYAIPILVVLGAVDSAGGLLVLPPLLMIVFRRRYPTWWLDWNAELLGFTNRVAAYLLLLDDRYPSTDDRQSVTLDLPRPDAGRDLDRWLPLVKWLLAIPHLVVLAFLWIAAVLAAVGAWFAILITGRYPRGIFDFVVGVMRWSNRVTAYALILVTDAYPPFSLRA